MQHAYQHKCTMQHKCVPVSVIIVSILLNRRGGRGMVLPWPVTRAAAAAAMYNSSASAAQQQQQRDIIINNVTVCTTPAATLVASFTVYSFFDAVEEAARMVWIGYLIYTYVHGFGVKS